MQTTTTATASSSDIVRVRDAAINNGNLFTAALCFVALEADANEDFSFLTDEQRIALHELAPTAAAARHEVALLVQRSRALAGGYDRRKRARLRAA